MNYPNKCSSPIFDDFEIKTENDLTSQMKLSLALNQRKIFIDGDINDETSTLFAYYLYRIEDMDNKFDLPKSSIEIFINTNGGDVTVCFMIVDLIEQMKSKGYTIITTNAGKAYSAGMAIALCGSIRKAFKRSRYMLHDISSMSMGKFQDMTEHIEEMKILRDTYHDIIKKYSNIDIQLIKDWNRIKLDKYFSAQELFELKGVDEII